MSKTFQGSQGHRLCRRDPRLFVANAADADAQEQITAKGIERAGEAIPGPVCFFADARDQPCLGVALLLMFVAMKLLAPVRSRRQRGTELLRTKWINLDVIWAAALILSGGLIFALPGA